MVVLSDGTGARIARSRGAAQSAKAANSSKLLQVQATSLRNVTEDELPAAEPRAPVPAAAPAEDRLPSSVDAFAPETVKGLSTKTSAMVQESAAAMAQANEAVLQTLRRKELEEIHERIAQTLDQYETRVAATTGGDGTDDGDEDGDAGGDDEDQDNIAFGSIKDKLMVLLLDYRKTCNDRKSVLTTMDAGLSRMLKDAEKDLAAADTDAPPASEPDSAESVLVAHLEARPVETFAAETTVRQQKLREVHEHQVSMLQEHISAMAEPLAASEQRGAQLDAEIELAHRRLARATADVRALTDELQSLEGQGKSLAQRLKERENMNETKARTQLGNTQQVKADAERARQKCEQLEGTLQALEARNKEELAALQASLNDALAQRDAAQAELPPLQEQLAAALGAHSGNDELQAALEQARRQLAEAKSSALRMHESFEARRSECAPPPPPPPLPPPHRARESASPRVRVQRRSRRPGPPRCPHLRLPPASHLLSAACPVSRPSKRRNARRPMPSLRRCGRS